MNVASAPARRASSRTPYLSREAWPAAWSGGPVAQVDLHLAGAVFGVGALEVDVSVQAVQDRVKDRIDLQRLLQRVGMDAVGIRRPVLR